MYIHKQKLQHVSSPEKPDAVYARKLQEVIGGQYGEITVAMQYSFQAWNAHIPGKYRDLLFSTAAEEFGHVEMLATMVAQLLEDAPLGITEAMLRPTLLPTYLRNNWGRDWGGLQKFTEIIPAPAAELDLGTARRSGLYDPAPMRSSGY